MPDWPCIVTAMSFNLTVTVKDGQPSVTASGDVKDGQYDVHGHEDRDTRTLGVAQRGPDGRYVSQVSHTVHKEV